MTSFLKRKHLLTKHTAKNAAKKTFLLTRYFLALIVIVNFFLCYVTFFVLSFLQAQDLSDKKKLRKNIEEIKNELLESIAEERSENADLVHKPENVLNLEDALVCVKQYEKHLQNEK